MDLEGRGASANEGHHTEERLACLRALERKLLWLSVWMIHNANHIRPKRDGLKVGGHQASCASLVTLLTALYFDVLRPEDRVAVKPHASPVFHSIQYLLGRQTLENLERFRALGGAQSYPSRTKDTDDVDFSTGSVGLGVALTTFAALVQEYVRCKHFLPETVRPGRMVALAGDAEFDEGNVHEALLEGWKHDVRNVWWVIDYNRQSLDAVVKDRLFNRIEALFADYGWTVHTLKYGKALTEAFAHPGGDVLRQWIDACPNSTYSALVYKGGTAWRERLLADVGRNKGVKQLLGQYDDGALHSLMTNLGGNDLETVLDAFRSVGDDRPTCFIAYTIKGFGLPLAGHKDNHTSLMSVGQMQKFREQMGIPEGLEWDPFAALDVPESELRRFLEGVPLARQVQRRHRASKIPVPESLSVSTTECMSTQEGFGRLLGDLALRGGPLADHIVTASPDVTVSTNVGGWVNRRALFGRSSCGDVFQEARIDTFQDWSASPQGQHIELGIAENNLFLLLAAAGLSDSLFGARLLPIGTLYDVFIGRGLDALGYACYQDARFLLVGTPSGISLAPEGGAHQSVLTPLIGMGQPGLTFFEPAYVDELSEIVRWSLEHMQDERGGAVYVRLSTRVLRQPERALNAELRRDICDGAYWLVRPKGAPDLAIACCGSVVSEALEALDEVREDVPGAGLLVATSPDRLHRGWMASRQLVGSPHTPSEISHAERMLAMIPPTASLVVVYDGHPAALSWLGAVRGQSVGVLGVDRFGQSGDVPDLYRSYGIDASAVVDEAARLLLQKCLGEREEVSCR